MHSPVWIEARTLRLPDDTTPVELNAHPLLCTIQRTKRVRLTFPVTMSEIIIVWIIMFGKTPYIILLERNPHLMGEQVNNENWEIVAKTVASAVPWVGGSVVTLWSELKAKKEARNLQRFLDALKEEASNNQAKIDALRQDISSIEERLLLLEETVEHLGKEWDAKKVPLYAKLFLGNVTSGNPTDKKVRRIEQLSELTCRDVAYLDYLVRATSTVQICDITEPLEDIILSFSKLEARGLIAETDHGNRGIYSAAASQKWDERWKHKFYTATPIGRDLITTLGF